jgi:hypothetical protein
MLKLSNNWFLEDPLDIEHKQYILLSYLKNVKESFNDNKLYPFLAELVYHCNTLLEIKYSKQQISKEFKKNIVGFDFSKMVILYEDIFNQSYELSYIDDIIQLSIPLMNEIILEGKTIYDKVESEITISELTKISFLDKKGYFIIKDENINLYQYTLSIYDDIDNPRILSTELIRSYSDNLIYGYDQIKYDLVTNGILITPTILVVELKNKYPFNETTLPIVKRILMKKILEN